MIGSAATSWGSICHLRHSSHQALRRFARVNRFDHFVRLKLVFLVFSLESWASTAFWDGLYFFAWRSSGLSFDIRQVCLGRRGQSSKGTDPLPWADLYGVSRSVLPPFSTSFFFGESQSYPNRSPVLQARPDKLASLDPLNLVTAAALGVILLLPSYEASLCPQNRCD